jgi:hypothetical protein
MKKKTLSKLWLQKQTIHHLQQVKSRIEKGGADTVILNPHGITNLPVQCPSVNQSNCDTVCTN